MAERSLHVVPAAPEERLESEVLTFLFADVRNYTRFTQEQGDEAAARLAAKFAAVARDVLSAHGGELLELRGDEVLAVFSSARQALRSAIELQERLARESHADPSLPLAAGIGLDSGEAVLVEGGYRGGALNLGARLCGLAAAGEVLASEAVIHLARRVEGLEYSERGLVQLKGLTAPVKVMQVGRAREGDMPSEGEEAAPEPEQRLPIGGFLGCLPSGGLVAREEELGRVLVAVHAADRGEGRLVLLAGEPGVGKTRLAQEVTLAAHNYGFVLAVGRCYEPQQSVPYYPFLAALAMAHASAPPAIRAQAGQRWPYLARLLPDQLSSAVSIPAESPEDQERLFRAVTSFLQAIAEVWPLALMIDDLHWADGATLQLVQHLARQTRGSRVLVLGSYRDAEVGPQHPLEALLRDLSREHLIDRVSVRRLHEQDTAALIGETLGEMEAGGEFAALVYRHTDGNAFFTQQVLQALIENGSVFREVGHWRLRAVQDIEVPESVRSVIGQRVSRLSPTAQELLQKASILGPKFAFDDVLQMKAAGDGAGELEDEIDAALMEGVSMGLLRPSGQDEYAFDHALTQQTLSSGVSPRRRRRLHVTAGEAVEKLPERKRQQRIGELAWHFLRGGDTERALRYAILAGDQAEAVFAHGEAEQHYQTALELAHEVENAGYDGGSLEATVRERLGGVWKTLGRYAEALDALEASAAAYHDAGALESEGRVAAHIGLIHALTGQPERGIARLEPWAALLEERSPSAGLAQVYAALVRLYNITGRQDDLLVTTRRLTQLADTLGEDRLLAEAQLHEGASLMHAGRNDEALPVLESAIRRAGGLGDLSTLCAALDFASLIYHGQQRIDKAVEYRARAVEVAERLGDPRETSYRAVEAAYVTFLVGDWNAARKYAERALTAALALDTLNVYFQPLCILGELSIYEGRWDEGAGYLAEAETVARHVGVASMVREVAGLLAERDILRGQWEDALDHVRPLLQTPGWEEHLNFLLPLAWAYLEVGDVDAAHHAADRATEEAARQRTPVGRVEALRIQGVIASRQTQWEAAEAHFRAALSRGEEITYPWGQARALYGLGLMYSRMGDRERAEENFGRARTIFERLGAGAYLERVQRAVQALDAPLEGSV
jgi:class 3 adenylate cyclase/tetratricopeptide (TPR) repeat protein